jgi:hypothetical protein
VRARHAALLGSFNKNAAGSSSRIMRLVLLAEPPSLDTGR